MNKYREERDKLKAYNAELREALAEARKQRDLVAEVASEAQAEAEKQNDIARRYYNLLAREQAKVERLRDQAIKQNHINVAQAQEVERLRAELEGETLLARDMVAEVERLREGNTWLAQKLDASKAEVERVRGFWEDSQVQHSKAADEVERLRAGQKNDGDLIEGLRQEVEQLRTELEEKKGELAVAYGSGTTKPEREWFSALDVAHAEVERLRVKAAKSEAEARGYWEENERLQEEVTRVRGFWEDSQVKHANAASEVERLQAENQSLRAHQAEAWDEVEVQHHEVERLRAWKDAAESGGGAGVRAANAEAEVGRLTTERDALFSSAATLEGKTERLQVIEAGFRAAYEPSQGEDDWYNRRLPLIRAAQDALKEVDDEGR